VGWPCGRALGKPYPAPLVRHYNRGKLRDAEAVCSHLCLWKMRGLLTARADGFASWCLRMEKAVFNYESGTL